MWGRTDGQRDDPNLIIYRSGILVERLDQNSWVSPKYNNCSPVKPVSLLQMTDFAYHKTTREMKHANWLKKWKGNQY